MSKPKKKTKVRVKSKLLAYDKKVSAEEVLPLIFAGIRRDTPAYQEPEKLGLSTQLIDDIIFAKITANYKALHKQFGKGFEVAYNAYKQGKGSKARKDIAEYIKKKKLEPKNPQPNNPYMKLQEGKWIDMSPTAVANRIRAMRDKSMEALKPIAEMTAKIQKSNEVFLKTKQNIEAITKTQREQQLLLYKNLTDNINAIHKKGRQQLKIKDKQGVNRVIDAFDADGNPIEYKSFNPFAFSNKNKTILGGGLLSPTPVKIPRVKPTGSARPAITGTGLTSYMDRHKMKNPVDFAKVFKTKAGKDYKVSGFNNLRFLCEQMNVTVEEALLYICEGMTSTNTRWKEHRLNKEYWRGSQSVINLVEYFEEQVVNSQKKKLIVYTVKALWNDNYTKALFIEYGVDRGSYSEFSRWFAKMKHHVYAYKKAKSTSQ